MYHINDFVKNADLIKETVVDAKAIDFFVIRNALPYY